MRSRAVLLTAQFVALGMILTACSGGSRVASASSAAAPSSLPIRCGEAAVAGRSLRSVPVHALNLPGSPDGIASTPDGRTSFVALSDGPPRIAVIDNGRLGERLLRTVAVPAHASGLTVTLDGRYVLGAAGRGAVVIDVAAAVSGGGSELLGSLTAPAGVAGVGPGAAEVAVSPDSRYAFVTIEGAGLVAVFDLGAATRLGFASRRFLGAIPVGAGALGIAVSPDGYWLYEVSESARVGSARDRGALNVIDVKRAVRAPAGAVVGRAAVACAPVRVAVAPDGAAVWVTARDGNALLGFSAEALRRDAGHALVSMTRVGEQPLGLAVVPGGRRVLVADSNLSRRARSGVSVVDTASSRKPALLGSLSAGKLPDAISVPPVGGLALVTDSGRRRVETLSLDRLP